jgi:formylglycine-generating enzyme required for sulfatase activity
MSKHEITNAQFVQFLNDRNIGQEAIYLDGSYPGQTLFVLSNGISYACTQWRSIPGKEHHAVTGLTWYGASEFAAYVGGRLPTEAEWEYACRGGTSTPFNTGSCLDNTQANYRWDFPYDGCTNDNADYLGESIAVNSYSSNLYGLFNMHGNVNEWCSDWYGAYTTTAQSNPTGPTNGNTKVLRGGGYGSAATYCRSAYRYNLPIQGLVPSDGGCRVVFSP